MSGLPIACVLMASGFARRFGENKLLTPFRARPLVEWAMLAVPPGVFSRVVLVTRYDEVAALAQTHGMQAIVKPAQTVHASGTIREGLRAAGPDVAGCCFMVSDQPLLSRRSVQALADAFRAAPESIWALGAENQKGNPVIFPAAFFDALLALDEAQTGSAVIRRHPQALRVLNIADARELADVDTLQDLSLLSGDA